MRLIIIDELNNKMQVGIDNIFYNHLDGTNLADNIHAVQWYGEAGEIEYKDASTGLATYNEDITDITPFQFAIDAWNAAKAAEEAEAAAQESQPE